jgi:hypothetical protein
LAVVATLSKGYDLDYLWKQVDRGPAQDAASYYIQATESGGEPPGLWWGPGAKALGFEPGQTIEHTPYDLLFGERTYVFRTAGDAQVQLGEDTPVHVLAVTQPNGKGGWPDPPQALAPPAEKGDSLPTTCLP